MIKSKFHHKEEALKKVIEKYGISEEDLKQLENRDFLTDGIIIILFAIPIAITIFTLVC